MAPRLILVSNRVVVPDPEIPPQAGGLVTAVNAALKQREGVWFGWSGKVSEGHEPNVTVHERRRRTFVTMDLNATDYQEYYNGFANRVLWPIFHYRVDLAEFTSVEMAGYLRVNDRFADALSDVIQPDDTIWIHDYQLLPLAKALRIRGHRNPIGFFLHIPCPPPDILHALPQHEDTVGALSHYDLVGLQTEHDAENLGRYFETLKGGARKSNGLYEVQGRSVRVCALPVAIETAVYARAARKAATSPLVDDLKASLGDKKLIVGVDRLDYTKGIPHRMQAFGQFLDRYPEDEGRVTLLQVTPKSRTGVPEYMDLDREVSTLVGQINGAHADPSWTPIRYVNKAYSRSALAGIYRCAHVGLVTPLRDGMNLVAKEYVASQDPEDPGVLILSQFAGAAEKMDGALIVNPHEPEAVAEAIRLALDMPLAERQERHRRMFDYLSRCDIDCWVKNFLSLLGHRRPEPGILDSIRRFFAGEPRPVERPPVPDAAAKPSVEPTAIAPPTASPS